MPNRVRETFVSIGLYLVVALVTLAGLEIVLRVADFRELRETLSETTLAYDFDAELGWLPSAVAKNFSCPALSSAMRNPNAQPGHQ